MQPNLYVWECMYVCTYVYTYIHTYMYMYITILQRERERNLPADFSRRERWHILSRSWIHTYTEPKLYVCMHVCTYIYIYIYIYMYMYIYIYNIYIYITILQREREKLTRGLFQKGKMAYSEWKLNTHIYGAASICMRMYVRTYVHTYTHTHISILHTHTHTHTEKVTCGLFQEGKMAYSETKLKGRSLMQLLLSESHFDLDLQT